MKSKFSKILASLLILVMALSLSGCGKDENKASGKKNNTEVKDTDKKQLKIVNTSSKSRPFAVMINNINVARPLQSGLQDAYLMYEIIVEGGITRYMALFMDQNTTRIGSIRSARHYFLDYALENDAIYVHHGQSPQAQNDFSALGVDRIVADNSKTGWRDKSLNVSSEHTLFTSIEKLNNGLGNKRTTRNNDLLLNYSVDEVDLSKKKDAKAANDITIQYSNSYITSYKYDENNKKLYWKLADDLLWEIIKKYIPRNKSITFLELGAGTGEWAYKILKEFDNTRCVLNVMEIKE